MDIPSPRKDGAFPLDGEGVWCEMLRPPVGSALRPALFLDRDGVVVEEVDYLSKSEDARLIPGAAEIIVAANRRGIPTILITNQSGIGRGYYGWDSFAAVQRTILDLLARAGAAVDAVYACPHHADGIGAYRHPDHPARKPNPGMLLRARAALRIELRSSWLVGDRASDLEAARRAGLAGGVHVLSGHGSDAGERRAALALAAPDFAVEAAPSVAEATALIPLLAPRTS
jgi:D-glycero-D-manno-heptose 1,7-bisphosphate phosphatase